MGKLRLTPLLTEIKKKLREADEAGLIDINAGPAEVLAAAAKIPQNVLRAGKTDGAPDDEKIVINKINILNEKEFGEDFSYEISVPKNFNNSQDNFIGIHTIWSFGNETPIDGL